MSATLLLDAADPNRLTIDEQLAHQAVRRHEQIRMRYKIDTMLQSVGLGRYSVQPEPLMLNATVLSSPAAFLAKVNQLTPPWTLDEKQRMLDEMVRCGVITNQFAAECLVTLGVADTIAEVPRPAPTLKASVPLTSRPKRVSKTRSK